MNSPQLSPDDPKPFRNSDAAMAIAARIRELTSRQWNIMEVCGGQTFTLSRYRLEELLPPQIKMIHGPGCPVCVTPEPTVDAAVELAMRPEVTLCSFGDMLRVPGSRGSLLRAKTAGADVRMLYSPLEALDIACRNPERQIIFFAIGFETTTPHYALMIEKASAMKIDNLSLLTSLHTVPAAVRAVKTDPDCRVDALIAAGHVCAITGLDEYDDLCREFSMPIAVGGFEPVDLLLAIEKAVAMLETGTTAVANAYSRVVSRPGNPLARRAVERVFMQADQSWRGMGTIAMSGKKIRPEFEHFDAAKRFNINPPQISASPGGCIAAQIMKGHKTPADCPHFRTGCTPQSPLGAPMVSSEGVCAAHYRYN